jgi:hypothetical protein
MGWICIIVGFFTTSSGLLAYSSKYNKNIGLSIANLVFFIVFTIAFELGFRYWRKKSTRELNTNPNLPQISVDDFKSWVFD